MKNKGFTLIELLGIFIIMAIIAILVVPNVSKVINTGKENINNIQIKKIIDSAYDYTISNIEQLPEYGEKIYVMLNQLKKNGFIDGSIINTTTGEEFPNDLIISVENVGKNYNNTYQKNYSIRGDYLYYLDLETRLTNNYINNKPKITISGYENSLFDSVNINEEFTMPSYSAISYKNVDITDSVVINIIYDSSNIESIDTGVAGIYYINYCVVDIEGYSNCSILSVAITDNELPSLTIPSSVTIGLDITEYDLMDGVSCTDNSGKCDIKISGNIKYGVSGKYIIEYIASDPSGNTKSEKRVITVG